MKPAACPFCGSSAAPVLVDAAEVLADLIPAELWAVCCDARRGGCGVTGGSHESKAAAVAAWNLRQPAPVPSPVGQAADAHDLRRLDADELDALRLAVGRERARRGWEPFPAFGDIGSCSFDRRSPRVRS